MLSKNQTGEVELGKAPYGGHAVVRVSSEGRNKIYQTIIVCQLDRLGFVDL